jgi:hypothetical protein
VDQIICVALEDLRVVQSIIQIVSEECKIRRLIGYEDWVQIEAGDLCSTMSIGRSERNIYLC